MGGALPPVSLKWPEPGGYVKYWDSIAHQVRFERLEFRTFPLKYPFRLPTTAPGSKTNRVSFSDLQPFEQTGSAAVPNHRYYAFMGVSPGAKFYLYHPYNYQTGKFDQRVENIQEDQTGDLEYADSPYDAPTRGLWIRYNSYPAVEALVTHFQNIAPSFLLLVAKYLVVPQEELPPATLQLLRSGQLLSMPVDAGGQL